MHPRILLLLLVIALAYVHSQLTPCETYFPSGGPRNQNQSISALVQSAFQEMATNTSRGLKKWFDGSFIARLPDYTNPFQPAPLIALAGKLVQYFGDRLGCEDGSINVPYTGDLAAPHSDLMINYFAHYQFLDAIYDKLIEVGMFSVSDAEKVISDLHSETRYIVCTESDCNSVTCNKYSTPVATNNDELIGSVVDATVNGCLISDNLRRFFNGTDFSINFTDPSQNASLAMLRTHLIQFFGRDLGCSDGTIANYNGRNLTEVHKSMPIDENSFNEFNAIIINFLNTAGFAESDLTFVSNYLNSTKPQVCTLCTSPTTTMVPTNTGANDTTIPSTTGTNATTTNTPTNTNTNGTDTNASSTSVPTSTSTANSTTSSPSTTNVTPSTSATAGGFQLVIGIGLLLLTITL